jgi:hypothetical protein
MSIGKSEKFIALPITYVELWQRDDRVLPVLGLPISSLSKEPYTAPDHDQYWTILSYLRASLQSRSE